ncbi:acyl-CoA dehydrogenase [Sphingobium aromaticivastans]|uniref:acyl-CoA dehydrogenase n=1 Tax=Sphingobium aromaticivastans TaxID=1778665 RepID=UPI0030189D28
MSFTVPVKDQLFLLKHVTKIDEIAANPHFTRATPDMIDAIVQGAAQFAEAEYAPLAEIGDRQGARWDDGAVRMPEGYRQAYRAFVANGWGTLSFPERFGGQDLPQSLAAVVMEDLGSANMGFSLINMLTPGAVEALLAYGTTDQQARWLPRLVTGEWNGTMNLTEPQAGSDVGALRSSATPTGDGLWKIKGQKIFITFGDHDLTDNVVHLVLARTPGAPEGTKGISLFLVPKYRLDADGNPAGPNDVQCLSIEHKLGIHASPTCVMAFGEGDDCLGEMIGVEGGGMRAMFTMMNNARLSVGSQGVQVAERATQQAITYALERRQSPRANGSSGRAPAPIADHPDVRRMLLRMASQTQAARALLYYAAGLTDRAHLGDAASKARLDLVIPLMKAHGTDIGCEVASLGIQVHGGMGFIEETGAARHLRDARIAPIYEGTNGIQAADLVGRKLMDDGGAALFSLIEDVRADAGEWISLARLAQSIKRIARSFLDMDNVDDRLAGSYPFLTMTATLICGWLMARSHAAAIAMLDEDDADHDFAWQKMASARYYLTAIVAEAQGLSASATFGADPLYAFNPAGFAHP